MLLFLYVTRVNQQVHEHMRIVRSVYLGFAFQQTNKLTNKLCINLKTL